MPLSSGGEPGPVEPARVGQVELGRWSPRASQARLLGRWSAPVGQVERARSGVPARPVEPARAPDR
jgi:hypothetical protein